MVGEAPRKGNPHDKFHGRAGPGPPVTAPAHLLGNQETCTVYTTDYTVHTTVGTQ